jgi:uncharacterized Zn-binding protein involved in type VI secretion
MANPENVKTFDLAVASIQSNREAQDALASHGWVRAEARNAAGELLWVEEGANLIVTTGRNYLLDTGVTGLFMGLIDNAGFSAIVAGDTLVAKGWTESTAYTQASRPAAAFSAAANGTKATSAPLVFSINATVSINGVMLATNGTKGGTTGILFAAKSFAAVRALESGDTLNVSYSVSLTAS